ARNRPCRDHNPIVFMDVQEWMPLGGEPRERRHRLALAAGGEEEQFRRWYPVDVTERDDDALGHLQEAQLARRPKVLLQAAADHGHPAAVLRRHSYQVLHAV